jgi:asparagine synthase (glutamine-hydrolysing)
MCGIFGIFNLDGGAIDLTRLVAGTEIQRHRGPDDEGFLLVNSKSGEHVSCVGMDSDPNVNLRRIEEYRAGSYNLGFGFRRLAIQDLSVGGHQPMRSRDGTRWIVFNGEIYNYIEVRAELAALGHEFHTGSDTEVILAAYDQWGIDCLSRFNGMWALAIWDSREKSLFCARDRFGEKPFHYVYVPGKLFAFASEIKALWASNVVDRRINDEMLALYRDYDQVDVGEQTFYDNILRLPHAHYLKVGEKTDLVTRRFWDIDLRDQEKGKPNSWYAENFRDLLFESVKIRLRADVPVGSSLSGGIDSSTVVTVMDRVLPEGAVQKTFSARFDDATKDEGKWIDYITSTTNVEPHAVWPTAEGMFKELEQVFWHQDEPFLSSSIYAQWCVMRIAREQGVTVLLDGQGADEMLAGYHWYFNALSDDLVKRMNLYGYWNLQKDYKRLHGESLGRPPIARVIKQSVPHSLKKSGKAVMSLWKSFPEVPEVKPVYPKEFKKVSELRKILWWSTTRHGLVELLRYADRNSMAHSREVRLPFLDHRLVEFAFRLPDRLIINGAWTKWILREAFRGIVPDAIGSRADKLGYMPPQARWLQGKDWKEIMLDQVSQARPLSFESAPLRQLA